MIGANVVDPNSSAPVVHPTEAYGTPSGEGRKGWVAPEPEKDAYQGRMDDAERKQWAEKGELPKRIVDQQRRSHSEQDLDKRQRSAPLVNKTGESDRAEESVTGSEPKQTLADLTPEQREQWRRTGELPKPTKESAEAPADSGEPVELPTGNHQPQQAPEEVRQNHERNYSNFQQHANTNADLREALSAIRIDGDRGAVILHAIADLPPEAQVAVMRDLAARPGAQAKLSQATREQVAAVVHQAGQQFAHHQAEETINQGFRWRVAEARKKYSDFDAVALNKTLPAPIKHGSVIDLFVATEEHGPDVLYHLAKNPKVLLEISKLTPFQQHRKLIEIESRISAGPPRTSAPKPVAEVGGRGTGWIDDSGVDAVRRNDYRAAKATWDRAAIKQGKL